MVLGTWVAVEVEVDDVEQPGARRDVHRRREHAEGGVPEPLVRPRLVLVDGAERHAVGDRQEPVTPVGRDVDAVRALGLRREAADRDLVELLETGGAVAEQVDGVVRLGADVDEVVAPRRLRIFGRRQRGEGQRKEQHGRRQETEAGAGRHQLGSPMLRGVSGSTSRTAHRPELKSVKKMVPFERLRAPDERGVGLEAVGIGRLEEADLPALLVEVAAQLAGDVHHPEAAVVVADVHDVVLDPEVVGAGLGHLVARHLPADSAVLVPFGDVDPAGGPVRELALGVEAPGEVLVAGEDQHLAGGLAPVGEAGVVPAVRVLEAPHHHGVVGGAALAAAADVHRDHPVGPVRGPGDAVLHPDVVDAVARGVELETSHPVGVLGILGVQDVVAPPGGQCEDVVLGHERVVDAAGQLVVVAGDDLDPVGGVRNVEDHQPVPPVGGAFPADDRELAVRRDLHVVHGAGVHPDGVHQVDARRIGHVPEVGMPVGAPGPGDRVVAAVEAPPRPTGPRCAGRAPDPGPRSPSPS